MNRTKIVCTLGPSSNTEVVLHKMMTAGMSVARLNFSHGTLDGHLRQIHMIRRLNKRYGKNVKLLGDLEGPRIRIGRLSGSRPVTLVKGRPVVLTQKDADGGPGVIPFDYAGSLRTIPRGTHVYIDDGNLDLVVTGHRPHELLTKVVVGGLLKEQKGVNIPGAKLDFGPLSKKDKEDIRFVARNRLDFIAQSFVRSASDVLDVREVLERNRGRARVVAKIENGDGIRNIDSIIDVSDGIMVARGDMGVSVPIYEIPVIQKMIIRHCNKAVKFVITATQMLESMTENRRPTRAEVTDVANAIFDGTTYAMLSAESAAGKYPVEAVRTMADIIRFTEDYLDGKATI